MERPRFRLPRIKISIGFAEQSDENYQIKLLQDSAILTSDDFMDRYKIRATYNLTPAQAWLFRGLFAGHILIKSNNYLQYLTNRPEFEVLSKLPVIRKLTSLVEDIRTNYDTAGKSLLEQGKEEAELMRNDPEMLYRDFLRLTVGKTNPQGLEKVSPYIQESLKTHVGSPNGIPESAHLLSSIYAQTAPPMVRRDSVINWGEMDTNIKPALITIPLARRINQVSSVPT